LSHPNTFSHNTFLFRKKIGASGHTLQISPFHEQLAIPSVIVQIREPGCKTHLRITLHHHNNNQSSQPNLASISKAQNSQPASMQTATFYITCKMDMHNLGQD
jgi:hypothetical protein